MAFCLERTIFTINCPFTPFLTFSFATSVDLLFEFDFVLVAHVVIRLVVILAVDGAFAGGFELLYAASKDEILDDPWEIV